MKHSYFLLLLVSGISFAQTGSPLVHGKVVDNNGFPIPGAFIYWPSGQISTSSDENGYFELVSTFLIDEIAIKSIGSETVFISKNLDKALEIKMKEYVNRSPYTSWFIADSSDIRKHKLDSLISNSVIKATLEPERFPMDIEKYLRLIMIYPKEGLEKNIEGIVEVVFTIKKDGRAERPIILKSLGENFDNEVIRMVESMPRWKPAKQGGYYIDVKRMLLVEFKINPFQKRQ